MQLFIQLDQLLWLDRHKLHTQTVSYVACKGDFSCVWAVELVVHAQCLLETSVTRSRPCHTAIRLTFTPQTYLEVTVHAANTFNLSHIRSPWFLPRWRYSAKVAPTQHLVFVKYLNALFYNLQSVVGPSIHTHTRVQWSCSPNLWHHNQNRGCDYWAHLLV